ncbi:MAG: hypothetical protein NTY50_01065 [Methylobacter sp.]|nr:hypothetical protein [Methylobacter sp.]
MKTENEIQSKTTKAKKLIANIIKSDNMLDIYTFVHSKAWELLGFNSLPECIKNDPKLPCYSKMLRIHKAVVFQKTYLPDTEVGSIKEGVLRPICAGIHTEVIRKRVAVKILKSEKGLDQLKKKDIETFIKSSKIVLSTKQKNKASEFAQLMITPQYSRKIEQYIEQTKMGPKRRDVFIRQIGLKVRSELKNEEQSRRPN